MCARRRAQERETDVMADVMNPLPSSSASTSEAAAAAARAPPRRAPRKSQVQVMRERTRVDLRLDWNQVAREEAEDVLLEITKMLGAALMLQRATRRWLERTAPQRAAAKAAREAAAAEEERRRRLAEEARRELRRQRLLEEEKEAERLRLLEAMRQARMSMPNLAFTDTSNEKKTGPILPRPYSPRRRPLTMAEEMDWKPPGGGSFVRPSKHSCTHLFTHSLMHPSHSLSTQPIRSRRNKTA